MIIGISGKIATGKDTISEIIQYLDYVEFMKIKLAERERMKYTDSSHILSFDKWRRPNIHKSGYDISGLSLYQTGSFGHAWEIKKWAGKLKEVVNLITGIPIEDLENQEFKNSYLGEEWSINGMKVTVREFLQRVGTDAMRDCVNDNIWVNSLMREYVESDGKYPNWIISDTRFVNEARAIKKVGGILVRVVRPKKGITIDNLARDLHPSETSLDNWQFDEIIENDGTIEELLVKVKTLMDKYHL